MKKVQFQNVPDLVGRPQDTIFDIQIRGRGGEAEREVLCHMLLFIQKVILHSEKSEST